MFLKTCLLAISMTKNVRKWSRNIFLTNMKFVTTSRKKGTILAGLFSTGNLSAKDVFIKWLCSIGETVGDYRLDENAIIFAYLKFEDTRVFLEFDMEMQCHQQSCISVLMCFVFDKTENLVSKVLRVCCKICTSYHI